VKYTIFTVEDEYFGLEIHKVVEILNPVRLHKVPELPAFISGVIKVRGEITPVVDMRVRFGVKNLSGKYRVLIVRLGEDKIGLHVDTVTGIVEIPDDRISRPPGYFKGFREEFIRGVGHSDDRIVIILDIEKVLTTEEKIELQSAGRDISL